ncbi:hypothetical protein PPACK8108_LOCUS14844 [Phakopsora pachyrhizi]|uniref:Uncharacterized protein n=1 Tax=Phakopsora pachyrhizi TaxID=170000 RepID=A0AAV0B8G5_PHAPC|nr:hypothetical protein PPACK8108_LOCUS14844 [Phakopsora pachyrhizi]
MRKLRWGSEKKEKKLGQKDKEDDQEEMSFDHTSWVAYKDANKAFANFVHQEIEDSSSKGLRCLEEISMLWKLSNGYTIQSAQEDPRDTQSQQRSSWRNFKDENLSSSEVKAENVSEEGH